MSVLGKLYTEKKTTFIFVIFDSNDIWIWIWMLGAVGYLSDGSAPQGSAASRYLKESTVPDWATGCGKECEVNRTDWHRHLVIEGLVHE